MESSSETKTPANKNYNFLINSSNQANMSGSSNISPFQLNSVFIMVSPYYVEKFNLEGLDLEIKMDGQGTMWINGNPFKTVELGPGVSILGISVNKQDK